MDNSSGQHVVVSKPLGVFCLRCHAGTSSGLPYFDKEDLAPAIRESETLKVLCQDVVKAVTNAQMMCARLRRPLRS